MDPSTLSLSHIKVNDYTFAYRKTSTSANNPSLLLVHGHISDLRSWMDLEPLLANYFTIYNISRRWAWPNEPIPSNYTPLWVQDSQDLIALIQALDIGPCHALGNSSGAFAIILAAKTHPHLFSTLLLEEPPIPLFYPTLPPSLWDTLHFFITHPISFFPVTYFGIMTIRPAIACAQTSNNPEHTLNIFGQGVLGAKFWKKCNDNLERKQQLKDNASWLHNFFAGGSLIPPYPPEQIAKIRTPALVLTGTDGPWNQQCIDSELFRLLGSEKKDMVWIQGAGHLVHEDNPEQVANAVKRFTRE